MSSKKKALQLIGKQDTSFITSTPLKSANFIVENVEKYTNESNVFQTVRKNAQAQPKKILEASQKKSTSKKNNDKVVPSSSHTAVTPRTLLTSALSASTFNTVKVNKRPRKQTISNQIGSTTPVTSRKKKENLSSTSEVLSEVVFETKIESMDRLISNLEKSESDYIPLKKRKRSIEIRKKMIPVADSEQMREELFQKIFHLRQAKKFATNIESSHQSLLETTSKSSKSSEHSATIELEKEENFSDVIKPVGKENVMNKSSSLNASEKHPKLSSHTPVSRPKARKSIRGSGKSFQGCGVGRFFINSDSWLSTFKFFYSRLLKHQTPKHSDSITDNNYSLSHKDGIDSTSITQKSSVRVSDVSTSISPQSIIDDSKLTNESEKVIPMSDKDSMRDDGPLLLHNSFRQDNEENSSSSQSPHQDVHSPHQDVHSPHQDVHSPHQDVHSPRQDVHSPHQDVHSPHQDVHSPRQDVHSPRQDVHSPRQDVHSPLRVSSNNTSKNKSTDSIIVVDQKSVMSSKKTKLASFKKAPTLNKVVSKKRQQAAPNKTFLSRSQMKGILEHYSGLKFAKEAVVEAENIFEKFFNNLCVDMAAMSDHAGRNKVNKSDLELIMKRQGIVSENMPLHVLIEDNMPLEYREKLLTCAQASLEDDDDGS